MTPVLKVSGISKSFKSPSGEIKAVNNVSISINEGECYGLVGESGCGKSTLSLIISHLQNADSGTVEFKGSDISKFNRKELMNFRRQLQIVFQDPYSSLNPKMTIESILEEPLKIHKIGNSKEDRIRLVNEIRTMIGLDSSVLEKYPSQLSGGQRQRIAIASSMILHPEFLICDESVSSLDVLIQAQILNLLKQMQKTLNMTYLFISHNLNVVSFMADRIGVMKNGEIVEEGPVEKILKTPQHPYTIKLLKAAGLYNE